MASSIDIKPELRLPELRKWVYDQIRPVATRQGTWKKVDHLLYYLDLAFFNLRPHKRPFVGIIPGYKNGEEYCFLPASFNGRALRDGLGGSTGDYKRYMRLFWDFPEDAAGYSKPLKLTKPYVLNDQTRRQLSEYWRSLEPGEVVDRSSGNIITAADLPKNGVVRSSYSQVVVPSLITFDLDRLNRTITDQELRGGILGERLLRLAQQPRFLTTLRWLWAARKWIISLGGIPNLYADFRADQEPTESNGRLHGMGELHLQRLKKPARRLLYAGTRWWDVDFASCHPTIMFALGRRYGLEMPILADYLTHRQAWHNELSEYLEKPIGRMKTVMTSTVYGQILSTSPHSSLTHKIGKQGVRKLREHSRYMALREELEVARYLIVQHHTQGDRVVNVVGKVRPMVNPKGRKVKVRKLVSLVLTGYEQFALNVALEGDDDVLVLMNDGWVSRTERNIQELEQRISIRSREVFGFDLGLRIEQQQFQ